MSEHDDVKVERGGTDLHTVRVAVSVPMIQSLLTGMVMSVLGVALALTFEWVKPHLWALWGFLIPTAGLWVFSVMRWFKLTDRIVQGVERVTNIDLNGDGDIGAPAAEPPKSVTVTVRDVHDDGHLSVMKYAFEGVSDSELVRFAQGMMSGTTLSESNWIGTGRLFGQDQFRAFRSQLIKRGWVRMRNGKSVNQGFELSPAGRAVMREIAKMGEEDSPTPVEEVDYA